MEGEITGRRQDQRTKTNILKPPTALFRLNPMLKLASLAWNLGKHSILNSKQGDLDSHGDISKITTEKE